MSEKSHKERTELTFDAEADGYDEGRGRYMLSRSQLLLRDLKIPENHSSMKKRQTR